MRGERREEKKHDRCPRKKEKSKKNNRLWNAKMSRSPSNPQSSDRLHPKADHIEETHHTGTHLRRRVELKQAYHRGKDGRSCQSSQEQGKHRKRLDVAQAQQENAKRRENDSNGQDYARAS